MKWSEIVDSPVAKIIFMVAEKKLIFSSRQIKLEIRKTFYDKLTTENFA
jgi:hypothetical protein